MSLDMNGNLVNSATGLRTQGWLADTATGVIDPNLPVSDIKIVTDKTLAKATQTVILGGNLSSNTDAAVVPAIVIPVSLGVYDSLGKLQTARIEFTRQTPGATSSTWNWKIVDPTGLTTPTGDGTITFDAFGQYDPLAAVPGADVVIPGSAGSTAPVPPLVIDFSKMTQLSAATSATVTSQDGLAAGTVSDVYIAPNSGIISLVYSNGLTEVVGQVALARFTNPTGLLKAEDTTFLAGLNSGEPQIGAADSGGRGSISSSYLEASNVDMAQEFTNMILAQRGFQASTKVITTSDEILQELVNLKR
jgi:flagellar hook protein FlgE